MTLCAVSCRRGACFKNLTRFVAQELDHCAFHKGTCTGGVCVGIAEDAECSVESDSCDVGLVCIATDFLEREGLVTPSANGAANGTAANGTASNGTAGNCKEP